MVDLGIPDVSTILLCLSSKLSRIMLLRVFLV